MSPTHVKRDVSVLRFRDADTVCSGSAAYKEPIGTKAVINPHRSPSPLPLSAHDAQSMGYHTGLDMAMHMC